jgi:hypothetical protein
MHTFPSRRHYNILKNISAQMFNSMHLPLQAH